MDEFEVGPATPNAGDVDMDGPMDCGFVGSPEPASDDVILTWPMQKINGIGRSYAREKRQACRKLVSEIYSPRSSSATSGSSSAHGSPSTSQ